MKKSMKKFLLGCAIFIWVVAIVAVLIFTFSRATSGFDGEGGVDVRVDVGMMETKLASNAEIVFVAKYLQRTGIIVSPKATQYPEKWREVFKDLGKIVPIIDKTGIQVDGIFHYISIQKYEEVLFYNDTTQTIDVRKEKGEVRGEKKSIPYSLIVVSVVIFLMILCLFLPRRKASEGQDFAGSF